MRQHDRSRSPQAGHHLLFWTGSSSWDLPWPGLRAANGITGTDAPRARRRVPAPIGLDRSACEPHSPGTRPCAAGGASPSRRLPDRDPHARRARVALHVDPEFDPPGGMITRTAVAGFAGLADAGSIASSTVTSNSSVLASDWFVLGKFISTGSCLAPPVVYRSRRQLS